jgi:hypothetical protein
VPVSLAFAVGHSAAASEPGRFDPPAAPTYATPTRAPRLPGEKTVASASVSFDPALDCVAAALAQRAPAPPDPRLYRNELPIACGSPLYVVDASVVAAGKIRNAFDHAAHVLTEPGPIALGVAPLPGRPSTVVVVTARRGVDLEPFPREGATTLRGTLLIPAQNASLFLSQATPQGVRRRSVEMFKDRRFEVTVERAGDADLELQLKVGTSYGPAARLRIGAGAGLVDASRSTLGAAVAAGRAKLGMAPLVDAGQPGDCDKIPARVAGIDVSDRASCTALPLIGPADLPSEVAYRAGLMAFFFDASVGLLQVGAAAIPPTGTGAAIRVLRRFETIDVANGRARLIEIMRRRWPGLRERSSPPGELAAIAAKLVGQPPDNKSTAPLNPAAGRIAGRWTTTGRYYSGVLLSRDFGKLAGMLEPNVTPLAIDAAVVQGRAADGALYHFAAIILELP